MIDGPSTPFDFAGLRAFIEALDVMAWIMTAKGEPVYFNSASRKIGEPPTTSAEFYDRIHPDDRPSVREVRERAFAHGAEATYDARFRIREGDDAYERVRVILFPVANGDGSMLGIGLSMDQMLDAGRAADLFFARYRQLVENTLIGVVTARFEDGVLLSGNDAFYRILGYEPGELPAGATREQMTPPEWMDVSRRASLELRDSGIMRPFEKEFFRKDGSRVPVLMFGMRRAGSQDESIAFVVDLSELKGVQRELSATQERFSLLSQLAPVMISVSTPTSFWGNGYWSEYTGLSGDARIEARHAILHPDDREAFRAAIERDTGEDEYRLRRHDGEYRWFFVRWRNVRDGRAEENFRIVTAIDVHDSHVLREQRDADLLRVADLLPTLVWSVRADTIQDYTNRAWARYCGPTQPQPVRATWSTILHRDDVAAFDARWNHCFACGETFELEARIRDCNGRYHWHLLRALPLRDEYGTISRWFGTATDIDDHKRALATAAAGERRYRDLAEAMPQIVWTSTPFGAIDYVNGRWSEFTGLSPEQAHGDGWFMAVPAEDRPQTAQHFREALSTAGPFSLDVRLRHVSGRHRWVVVRARPEFSGNGSVERWIGTFTDVDNERRIAEEQAYLAEASRLLGSSLDIEETLAQVAALAVPVLGDWCEIDLVTEDGEFKTAAVAHYDAEKHRLLQTLIGRTAAGSHPRLGHAVDHQETRIYNDVQSASIAQSGYGDGYREVYERAGLANTMVVPLIAGSQPLGAISYVSSDARRGFSEADQRFGEELARRAALSIQNAQLYSREHRVADALQSASLPKDLPDVPAVEMSAIYVPGHSEAMIGGDWFDAFRLRDGRLVLSIGDVAGSGLDAAVTMSNMRQIIRGTAQVHADPVLMLNAADRALRLEEPDRFVTAFVGVLDPITRSLTYASAGHLPPYVRHPSGRLEELAFSDLPLGLRHRSTVDPRTFEVPDNAILVMYTDGLIESQRDLAGGIAALEAILRTSEFGAIDYPAEYLREQLLSGGTRDDVAILTLRFLPEELVDPLVSRWTHDPLDAKALADVRQRVRASLVEREFRPDQIEAAQLVLGELAGNVVRHAPGPVEIVLDFTGPAAVLHVLDEGPGFERAPMLPSDVLSESGRGLYIVSEMSELFGISRRPHGGSHARAVLAGPP